MKIKTFVKFLFCVCCLITLSAYGMHNIGTINVITQFIDFPSSILQQKLKLGSYTPTQSPTKKTPVAIFKCDNVNGPEVGEKPNKLVMRFGDNAIATITIDQCRQAMPCGLWKCKVNISCGRRYACSIDPHGRTTKLNVFKVVIIKR